MSSCACPPCQPYSPSPSSKPTECPAGAHPAPTPHKTHASDSHPRLRATYLPKHPQHRALRLSWVPIQVDRDVAKLLGPAPARARPQLPVGDRGERGFQRAAVYEAAARVLRGGVRVGVEGAWWCAVCTAAAQRTCAAHAAALRMRETARRSSGAAQLRHARTQGTSLQAPRPRQAGLPHRHVVLLVLGPKNDELLPVAGVAPVNKRIHVARPQHFSGCEAAREPLERCAARDVRALHSWRQREVGGGGCAALVQAPAWSRPVTPWPHWCSPEAGATLLPAGAGRTARANGAPAGAARAADARGGRTAAESAFKEPWPSRLKNVLTNLIHCGFMTGAVAAALQEGRQRGGCERGARVARGQRAHAVAGAGRPAPASQLSRRLRVVAAARH